MARTSDTVAVDVPLRYPTSLIYVDESSAKATGSSFFVIGAVKVRESGRLNRAIRDVRDRHQFEGEFKFNKITRDTMGAYFDAIDEMAASDAHLAACVVRRSMTDPFKGKALWLAQAEVTAQLLVGCINRRELVAVLIDGISTPRGCSLDDTVRSLVNKRLRCTSVVAAACLDSRSTDGLQLADMFAGAVAFERKRASGYSGVADSPKAKVAARMTLAFGQPNFADMRTDRVNIATWRGATQGRSRLRVVKKSSRAG